MRMRLAVSFVIIAIFAAQAFAQATSVQLKIKEKSGFLGLGGPRLVNIQLSNETLQQPLTSENVNGGQEYFFFCTPAGDWRLDADFVTEDLASLVLVQDTTRYPIEWQSEVLPDSNGSVLFGFSRSLKLHQPFLVQIASGENVNQASFSIPEELWPGFTAFTENFRSIGAAIDAGDAPHAIQLCERLLKEPSYTIFPAWGEIPSRRTAAFAIFLTATNGQMEKLAIGEPASLTRRIASLDSLRPTFSYLADSLQRPEWQITATQPPVNAVLTGIKASLARFNTLRDSMTQALDEWNIRWILDGSVSGKNGFQYQYMIETLAYAFATLNPADTTAGLASLRVPEELMARLQKQNIVSSFETFVRVCEKRFQRHETLFPPDFLPNLHKDSLAFPLPYYSVLRAVNEYFGGSLASANEEIAHVIRVSDDPDLTAAFDRLRMFAQLRQQNLPTDALSLLASAQDNERSGDTLAAQERYRQLSLVAPTFALGYFSMGTFYERLGSFSVALFAYQRAYQIDTLYLTAYRNAARLQSRLALYPLAIEILNLALQKGNDCWDTRYSMGTIFMAMNDPTRAVQQFEKARLWNNRSYETDIQLGIAYQALKNFSKARECYNNAIGLDPTRQEAVDHLSKLNELQKSGR